MLLNVTYVIVPTQQAHDVRATSYQRCFKIVCLLGSGPLFFSSITPSTQTSKYKRFTCQSGLEVIKLEFILKFKAKRNDWLLADTCPQAANQRALF